ncbi:hypothetical protein [Streptomyces sp. NPDC059850]|uniref:hypothetical protein n=1 Tax=Streptomyces sp. NPDC059850 TaxID=3346970 RepID=UPI00364D0106
MARPGTQPSHDVQARTRRSAPPGAHGPGTGHPRRAHADRRRRGPARVLLALSVVMLVMGMVLPQGPLLAAGLVTAGAAHLLAPPPDRGRPLRAAPRPTPAGDHQSLPAPEHLPARNEGGRIHSRQPRHTTPTTLRKVVTRGTR